MARSIQYGNYFGNRLVETQLYGNAQAWETKLVEIDSSFSALP
jgi:hypothetical protein